MLKIFAHEVIADFAKQGLDWKVEFEKEILEFTDFISDLKVECYKNHFNLKHLTDFEIRQLMAFESAYNLKQREIDCANGIYYQIPSGLRLIREYAIQNLFWYQVWDKLEVEKLMKQILEEDIVEYNQKYSTNFDSETVRLHITLNLLDTVENEFILKSIKNK